MRFVSVWSWVRSPQGAFDKRSNQKECRDPGSNRGPSDLRSDALPTELSRLMFLGAERSPQDSVSRPHDLLYKYIYFHSRMLQAHFVSGRSFVGFCSRRSKQQGLFWELNPGPLAPEARIIPPDQTANWYRIGLKILEEQKHVDQTFVLGRASSCEDQPHCLLSVLVIEYGRSGD